MKIIGLFLLTASFFSILFFSPAEKVNTKPGLFELNPDQMDWIESNIEEMTLFEKCAQLVIPYAYAYDTSKTSDEYRRMIKLVKDYKVGGFLFLSGELSNQIKLTNELQAYSKIPLLISSDFERGPGMRYEGAVEFPYNMAFGAADDPHLTYLAGRATAEISRKIGVHQNYAPLVDVSADYRNPIINIRSFAENPFNIAVHASAFIRGMNDGGMISTAKHFPGHGSTDVDSHNEIPLINLTVAQLEESDLIPFREAISAGVKSVMVGHLDVPAFEEEEGMPATLSENIVGGLLKKELRFNGLVVTDAMNMHSITDRYPADEAAVKALEAGNDLILFPENDSAAIWGIYNAVLSKRIPEDRIDESLNKILMVKSWLGLNGKRFVYENGTLDENDKLRYRRLAREIAEKSITLVKDKKNLIPIVNKRKLKIISIALTDLTERKSIRQPLYFNQLVKKNIEKAETIKLHLKSRKRDFRRALRRAKKADLVILPIYMSVRSFKGEIGMPEKYLKFINNLLRMKKRVAAVSFGDPYLLKDIPGISTYLCAYGSVNVSEEAALDALLGKIEIQGKLPVTIPNTGYKRGSGIYKNSYVPNFISSDDSLYDFSDVDTLMERAIEDSVFPGAVLLVGRRGRILHHKAFGRQTYDESSPNVTIGTLFDLASVSKVVGTTSAAMLLYDKGKLALDAKVAEYLPEFGNNGKENITVRNLLLHNAGLIPFIPFYKYFNSRKEVIDSIMRAEIIYEPGSKYLYSDLGMITLQLIIEKITGKSLDKYLKENVFQPLEMTGTMYNPPEKLWRQCMPTEVDNYWRMDTIRGKVHDEAAYLMGGVAGHAGIFSTAGDISKLIFTLLNNGQYKGKQIFSAETVENWTTKQSDQSTRGLGWDTKSREKSSAGHYFSMRSFGHTGFTGTSVWADKESGLFVILLTNRVHPTRKNRKIIKFRPVIHDAIFKAVAFSSE